MDDEVARHVVDVSQPKPAEPAGDSSTPRDSRSKIFNKWEFLAGPTTGHKTKNIARENSITDQRHESRAGSRRRLLEGTDTMEADLGGEINKEFNNYLTSRVGSLVELAIREAPEGSGRSSQLDYVLESGLASGGERRLIEACTDVIRDRNDRQVYTLNPDKVDAFLSTAEGYKYTVQDMEQVAAMSEMGLNMRALMLPELQKRQLYARMDDMFGKGGRLMDTAHWALNQTPQNIYRFFHATRYRSEALSDDPNGDRLESVRTMQALPPADRAYIFSVLQINVDAFDPITGRIRDAASVGGPSEIPESMAADTILKNVGNALNARRMFLEELGVDLDKTYTADQVLIGGENRLAIAGTNENIQLLAEFDQQAEAMAATLGRALNDTERRSILNHVRIHIKTQMIDAYIRNAETKSSSEREGKDLDEKYAERTDPAKRQEYINKRRTINEKDRAEAKKRSTEVTAAQTELVKPLESASRKVEEMESRIIERSHLPITGDIEASIEAKIDQLKTTAHTGLTDLITKRNTLLDKISGKREAAGDNARNILSEYNRAIAGLAGTKGTINPPNAEAITAFASHTIEGNDGPQLKELNDEIAKISGEITVLETERNNYRNAQSERTAASLAVAHREPEELQNNADRLARLQALGVATDDEIRNLVLPELMQRIRATGLTDENEILQIASFAKSELNGQDYETHHPPLPNELNAFNAIIGLGLNAQDVLLRTEIDLARAINASGLGWTPKELTDNILAARHLVTRRLSTRYGARLTEEAAYWEGRATPDADEAKELGRTIDREATQLKIAKEILKPEKREEIYGRANDILNPANQDLRDRLVSRAVIAPTDPNYSQEERNKGLPSGYVEWLRTLYPEYHGKTDEADLFNALHASLPPEQLARILNERLGLGLRGRRITIDNALQRLNRDLAAGTLNRDHFAQAFIGIVTNIRQRASAL